MHKLPIEHAYTSFRIVLIGAGGTGGNAAPMISRLITGMENIEFVIVDGDIVEFSNLERQPYLTTDIARNKAEMLSSKINAAFGLNSTFYPEYITELKTLEMLFSNDYSSKNHLDILISAVDNHEARAIMENYFAQANTLVYIDSANEDYFGDVILGAKVNNAVELKTRAMYRPKEVFSGTKRVKNNSCEVKANDNPQYYPANQFAASIVLKMVSDIVIENNINAHFVNYNTHFISFDTDEYMMLSGPQSVEVDADVNYYNMMKKPFKEK